MFKDCVSAFLKIIEVLFTVLFSVAAFTLKVFLILLVFTFKMTFSIIRGAQYN